MNIEAQKKDLRQIKEISRVTWVGFWLNFALSAIKISAGIFGNSRAVVADGIHSFSDQLTDIAILVGVRFWSAPPDQAHPYGHKRLESMVALGLGLILAVVGISIAWDAASRLNAPVQQQAGSLLALAAALLSIVIKEILYRWTIKKGRQLKSSAVIANAWHHRSDVFSSIPIAITVAVVLWFPSLAILDLVGALVVSGFILYASWNICRPAINTLLDKGASEELHAKISSFCLQVPGIREVHDLRSRYMGQGLSLDLHVSVDGGLSIIEGDKLAHQLQAALYSPEAGQLLGVDIIDVLIHLDPWQPDK